MNAILPKVEVQTLIINITNEEQTFTEQLEKIILDINEGYTSGKGWSISELEADKKEKAEDGYFEITSIHRNDLRHGLHFTFTEEEIAKLTDEDMSNIASRMAEAHFDGQFWNDLKYYTDEVLNEKE